jgi:hypothetical protein
MTPTQKNPPKSREMSKKSACPRVGGFVDLPQSSVYRLRLWKPRHISSYCKNLSDNAIEGLICAYKNLKNE